MFSFPRWLARCLLAAAVSASAHAAAPTVATAAPTSIVEATLDGGRFGLVHTYRPAGQIANVALFFSGDGGWKSGVADMARRLAHEGFLVAGVDTTIYMASIQAKDLKPGVAPKAAPHCTYMAGDVEALSQHLQWSMKLPNYLRPVLFGYSAGSSVVYGTLAQSPRGTFAGGVSLSFCAEFDTGSARLCPGEGLHYKTGHAGQDVVLQPDAKMSFPWTVVHGGKDDICTAAQSHGFVAAIPTARLIALPKADHDLAPVDSWWPKLRDDYRAMLIADTAVAPPPIATPVAADDLSDLPITEVPVTAGSSDTFAVMISGDGGWAGLDQGVSGALAARGIPVIGLNSLKYFWHARTPETTATDVNRIIEQYAARWHKRRVLLVGYSFGADVMPFVFNRLPATTRAQVVSVSMLGLGPGATYEVTVGEWLPGADKKGDPVVPEVARMTPVPRLCVMGDGEKDSSCPELAKMGVTVRLIGDGHHFGGLADTIVEAIVSVSPAAPKAP